MRRLPTRIKQLRGTARPDRDRHEPRPRVGAPAPRRTLPADVKAQYRRLVRQLRGLDVLTIVDGQILELTALALAEVDRYSAVLDARGATYETTTPQGSQLVRQRPELQLRNDAARRALNGLKELGLTPASRGKVESLSEALRSRQVDALAAFRAQKGKGRAL